LGLVVVVIADIGRSITCASEGLGGEQSFQPVSYSWIVEKGSRVTRDARHGLDVDELVRLVDVGRREKDEGRIRRLAISEIIPKIDVTAADGKVVKGRLVAVIIGSQIGDEHQVGVAAVAAPKVPAGPVQAGVIDMIGVVVPVVVETEPMGGAGIDALGVDDASMDPGWAVDRPDLARSGESRFRQVQHQRSDRGQQQPPHPNPLQFLNPPSEILA